MRVTALRGWMLVNLTALAAGIATIAVRDLPAKIAAEPNLVGGFGVPLGVAAGVWLMLAVLRYWLSARS